MDGTYAIDPGHTKVGHALMGFVKPPTLYKYISKSISISLAMRAFTSGLCMVFENSYTHTHARVYIHGGQNVTHQNEFNTLKDRLNKTE